jgi:glucose/arabinose dehydrogenase
MAVRLRVSLVALATIAIVASGCSASAQSDAPSRSPATVSPAPPDATETPTPAPAPTAVEPEALVTGLKAPWSVAFYGETVLISERDTGNILEVVGNKTRVIGKVTGLYTRSEAGLLGIVVDDQARLYAYSTSSKGNRIQRFLLSGSAGTVTLGNAETILSGIPHAPTHNGGRLAFGPDGMLYATTGDAGDRAKSQKKSSLAGKILRMTPDGDVPADNPFAGSFVYSYGHRNPQGIAWDSQGRLIAAEFGQNTWDELNIITPGSNYGWPTVEGIAKRSGFVDPILQWAPSKASPSGIAIINDVVFIASLRGQRLHVVPLADPSKAKTRYVNTYGRLRDAIAAPDGTLWLLTNNTDGRGSPEQGDDQLIRVGAN